MLELFYKLLEEVFIIKKYDLAIIGAGPVGLYATNYSQLHGLKTVVFDSLSEIGGQPRMLYPFKTILDIPAIASISGEELISNLQLDASINLVLNHEVKSVEKTEAGFTIDNDYQVRSVIIATGNGAFNPRKFPVNLDKQAEKHVHYFVKDPTIFANQKVGVFGGGDSALDWALELAKTAKEVTLIHRRNEFRGLESNLAKLQQTDKVTVLTPFLPKEAALVDDQLEILLKEVGSQTEKRVKFDQIVVAYGFKANNRFVKKWGVELDGANIATQAEMKTNIDGIYAIGDVVSYPGRVPIIGVGFGEAQIAINSIMRNLFPEKSLTIHSTSL